MTTEPAQVAGSDNRKRTEITSPLEFEHVEFHRLGGYSEGLRHLVDQLTPVLPQRNQEQKCAGVLQRRERRFGEIPPGSSLGLQS